MPEKARLIVTVWPDTADKVAVTVATPPASFMGLPLRLKVTFGGMSLSVTVYVCVVGVPNVALVGFDSVTSMVSSGSSKVSSTMSMGMIRLVTPGAKVRVPLARV